MVIQKGIAFCELQNSMDFLGQVNDRNIKSASDTVEEDNDGKKQETVETLQSAFLKFKRNRQNKLRQSALREKKLRNHSSEEQVNKLREKFVEQARSYLGVPYARRYHEPGSPEYNAPLFLDCCGLVRKVLRDLKEDFGFSIGPWNQAYMFDTLPNTIEDVEDMKPGDLVFVSGTFYNPKKRKQKHDIVHVEIWAGDGEKTIGARWQKEKVQIHELYQYVSKSYYDMVYHFKSIDTWLNGICESFCSQHSWKSSSYVPGKKSIFSVPQEDEPADDFGEEQFSKEIKNSSEMEKNSFGRNSFKKKAEDVDEVNADVLNNEENGLRGETDVQGQNHIVYTKGDITDCKTKIFFAKEQVIEDRVSHEKKKPSSYETGFSQNPISYEEITVVAGLVTPEEKTVYCLEEDIPDWSWQDFYQDEEAIKNFCAFEKNAPTPQEEPTAQETNVSFQNVAGKESKKTLQNTTFENACFCKRCMSDAGVLQSDENSKHDELLHCNQTIKTEIKNGSSPCISLKTENQFRTTLGQFCTDLDDKIKEVGLENTLDKMNEATSRPNTEGVGAGNPRKQRVTTQALNRRGKGGSRRRGNGDDDQSYNPREPSKPFCRSSPSSTRLHQKTPTFFIGGHNGAKMVEATLSSFGWKRIYDNTDTTFFLKWVECKRNLDFASFREGEQLVNHIPNGNLLTTKIGLLTSLQEFDRVSNKVPSPGRKGVQMKEFVPETFKLQNSTEINNFIHHVYQDGEMWICKPTGMNQGKGIFLIRSREELHEKLGPKVASPGRQRCFPAPGRVIQRYILNPFLLNGFKADIRTYMLIAGTSPYMVFYHPGYVRLSLVPYSLNQEEVHAHLTNQYIQKKHPLYDQVKEETVWSLQQLQEYINKTTNNTLAHDWVYTTFTKRMQEIMVHCFQSVRYKLEKRLGYFDLLGFDFMLDENLNVWLIEINVNPALHTNCKILSGLIPDLVDTTLKLVLEVFEKSKRKERMTPLENLGKFQLIFSDEKR